jgi:hypothetical protein
MRGQIEVRIPDIRGKENLISCLLLGREMILVVMPEEIR